MVSRLVLFDAFSERIWGMRMGNRPPGAWGSRSHGGNTLRRFRLLGVAGLAAALALTAAACSSSGSSSSSSSASASATGSASGSATVPAGLSIGSFTVNIGATMSQLKALGQAATKGSTSLQVGVVLPDTTSSTRWVDFDAPYLKQSFTDAGFTSSEYRIQNAQGSDATQLSDATADINLGAKILIVCPLDGPTGVAIAKLAEQKGVTLIAYDRAIFQGTNTYYVSFDNVLVGTLIGQGFQTCISSWGIKSPKVFVLNGGEDTDPNAISFASGWDNTKGGTIFQQEFTAHPSINATIEANDGLANAVITDLKSAGVKPKTIPTTGQDATSQGMAWILEGYQCGSVYRAVYKEAQDAVTMATILLAGKTPPTSLLNGTTVDPANSSVTEPASLLTPVWVTKANMESTVVADGFDTASQICTIAGASACSAAGIH